MLVCTLEHNFILVGPLHALVKVQNPDYDPLLSVAKLIGTISTQNADATTATPPFGTVWLNLLTAPVVLPDPKGTPTILANTTTLRIYGQGYSAVNTDNRVTLMPGGIDCRVLGLISQTALDCVFDSDLVYGGPLSAVLHVMAEEEFYDSIEITVVREEKSQSCFLGSDAWKPVPRKLFLES